MFRQDVEHLTIFSGFDPGQLQRIAPLFGKRIFCKGEVIFEQGQPARYLYLVLRGAVTIRYKPYDGPLMTVANIQSGQIFGWSSALGRALYTSSAVADDDCVVLAVSDESLKQLCRQDPETGKILIDRMAAVIAERLNSTHTEVKNILSQCHALP